MLEAVYNNYWLWILTFFTILVVVRVKTGKWKYILRTFLLLAFLRFTWWFIENVGDIALRNLLDFPNQFWNDTCRFWGSFYDPNEGFLENIFYNDWTWLIIFLILLVGTGGQSIFLILVTMLVIWLLGQMIIVAFGIKFFFVLVAIVVVFMCFIFRGNRIS